MRHFERVHEQHPIDISIREWQIEFVDQCGKAGPGCRPFHHTLGGRHECKAAFRFFPEETKIGRGIANPEHTHSSRIRKPLPNTAANEATRYDAEVLRIEVAQIDDIYRHAPNVA
jgi:hypothetical protein